MLSLRISLTLAAALLAMPMAVLADHIPLSGSVGYQFTPTVLNRPVLQQPWGAFLAPIQAPADAADQLADLQGDATSAWNGIAGGGVERGGLFTIVDTGHDVVFGLGDPAVGSIPTWPIAPSGVRPVGGGAGPNTPGNGSGGGSEVVLVPLPAAAYMGMALLLGLGGASGVRKAARRRPIREI